MIKLLIADDHHLVRTSIAHLINQECDMTIIGEAADGESAVAQCRGQRPDIVLMDTHMPGIGGLEAIRRICRGMSDIKVLVLTAHIEGSLARHIIEAGAAGFLSKSAYHHEMLDAIRHVFHGRRYIGHSVAQRLALTHVAGEANRFNQLSRRELQIALMVVNGQRVCDIAEHLHLSSKTINAYRYRVFAKLDIDSDVKLTHLALHHGLVDGFDAINA
ncbi:UvrY/SirA/GacA family response regulator transcription factor [Halomonas cibimaris]|uniref:UvrY/SirA/GacA family response regulator transcription factor n=1 Tax=Halomonas cibimaris TaxID=657012 RepID=A0ABP7LL88_9GAMM